MVSNRIKVIATLGMELTETIPLLGCALLSTDLNGNVALRSYYSDMTMVLESWNETARPSSLRMKFVFKNTEDILFEGRYCVQMVFNGWLTELNCNNAVIFVDVFHLPIKIYQYPSSGCEVAYEVADYLYFTRNFARHINVINREMELEQADDAMLCRFD